MSQYFQSNQQPVQAAGLAHQSSPDCACSSNPDACKRLYCSKELVFYQVSTMKRDDDSHSMSNSQFQILSVATS